MKLDYNILLELRKCMLHSAMILLCLENFPNAHSLITVAKTGGMLQACCGNAMLKVNKISRNISHDNKHVPKDQLDFYGDLLKNPNYLQYHVPTVAVNSGEDEEVDEYKSQTIEVDYGCLYDINIVRLGENKTLRGGNPWYQILSPDYPDATMATSDMTFTCDITVNVGTIIDIDLIRASNPGNIVLAIDKGNVSTPMDLTEWPASLDLVQQFEKYDLLREIATDETVSLNFKIPAGNTYIFWISVAAPNIRRIQCSPVTGTPMSFSPCPQMNITPITKTDKEDIQLTSDPKTVLIFAITLSIYGGIVVIATIAALIYIFRKSIRKAKMNSLAAPGIEDLQDAEQPDETQNGVRNIDASATSNWGNRQYEGYLKPVDSRNGKAAPYDEFDISKPGSDASQNNDVLQTSTHDNEAFEPDYLNDDIFNELKRIKQEEPGLNQKNNMPQYQNQQDNNFQRPDSNEDNVSLHSYVDISDQANLYHMLGDGDDLDDDDEPNAYKPKDKRKSKMPSRENNADANVTDELKMKLQARKIISEKE